MKQFRNGFAAATIVIAALFGMAGIADAQRKDNREVRDALRSLRTNVDNFESEMRYQMQSSSANNGDLSRMTNEVRRMRDAVEQFQANLDRRRENRADVENILSPAIEIENYLKRGSLNRRVESEWSDVKRQVDRLAANYGVTAGWNEEIPDNVADSPGQYPVKSFSVGLAGTYDIDLARSERIDDVISSTNLGNAQRDDLRSKLEAPAQIAIDIRGDQITLATTNASPVTFQADGRETVERSATGRNVRLRASMEGNTLTVSSLGGETDFTVIFASESNGRVLKVTRRVTTEYLDQTVFSESIYDKSDAVARLGIDRGNYNTGTTVDPNGSYSDNDRSGNTTNGSVPSAISGRTGNFIVPNQTVVTGVLDNDIDTKVSQNNDRFRLIVQSPDDFRGATIDGYISGVGRSGQVSGRSNVTLNFQTITLRDGKTYDFAGNLQSVKDLNGKDVNVDTEGTARGDSQTKETAKRGGIGAGIGALIGAIAGGAKGAVIGAVIGGGAGAGSVAIMGRDDIRLQKGSTITVQSSSPIRGPQDR